MSRHRHRNQQFIPQQPTRKQTRISVQFKDGTEKHIQMDSKVFNGIAMGIAFTAGLVTGGGVAWCLKK